MGSNQSSASSFSIDPSGNVSARRDTKPSRKIESGAATPIDSDVGVSNPAPNDADAGAPIKSDRENVIVPRPSPVDLDLSSIPTPPCSDQSLVEKENNLSHCYRTKRPLECQEALRDYQNYIALQRSQVLRRSLSNTMLVFIVCILLHITTVSCFAAMSIDLGSEWMKVGLVAPSVQMDIVLNAQSQRKTAMAVAYSNGERFVGDIAMDIASKYPERTYTHFLDLVGKSVDHESVKLYKRRFPYANITSHEPNSTSILLNHPEGLSFTPLELIAMMLKHAHDQVVSVLNSNEPASDVVITVPPFFNQTERRVIQDAAKLAGLNVLRLTNVNSAFALSYGIFRHKDYIPESSENKTSIIFFDQGASFTSATLADYYLVEQIDPLTGLSKNESIPTVAIRGQVYDRYLGGFDMQLKLRDYLVTSFADAEKIDESRIYNRGRSIAKLQKEAGRVKKVLSANNDFTVRVENVIDDKDLKLPITRQKFEELSSEFMSNRIKQLLDNLFEMPSVSREDPIESVIIVGGNTRTPKIQQLLLDYFKLTALGKSINADEGAALAALYQAASLGRGFKVKRFILEEFGEERKFATITASPIAVNKTTSEPTPEVLSEVPSEVPSEVSSEVSSEVPSEVPSDVSSEVSSEVPSEEPSEVPAIGATTLNPTTTTTTVAPDPDALYSEIELNRIKEKLSHLDRQDELRLQRESLRNALESLQDEETTLWLENASHSDLKNITLLAERYTQATNQRQEL